MRRRRSGPADVMAADSPRLPRKLRRMLDDAAILESEAQAIRRLHGFGFEAEQAARPVVRAALELRHRAAHAVHDAAGVPCDPVTAMRWVRRSRTQA
jgi:hypothetical protein